MSDLYWIFLIAILVGVANAVVGSLLVLRRSAMLGDAMSHTVLLGLVGVFLVWGTRDVGPMLLGAVAVGILTSVIITALTDTAGVPEDASIGVTFTVLFALAVTLISTQASSVDIDQDCVLHGELALAVLQRWELFGRDLGPRALWLPLCTCVAAVVFLWVGYHRLQLLLFDRHSCIVQGHAVRRWDFACMALAALTIVSSFEAVGSIVVLAMLVIPPATALLFATSLAGMVGGAIVAAVVLSICGVQLAFSYDLSIAGSIATVGIGGFALALAYRGVIRYLKGAA